MRKALSKMFIYFTGSAEYNENSLEEFFDIIVTFTRHFEVLIEKEEQQIKN